MVDAVYKNMAQKAPKNHFTVGINDDISHTSLTYSREHVSNEAGLTECKFYGLGSDGTVGANKNSATIISDHTDMFAQAYFVYDSKKSGGTTTSHVRFSKKPIRKPYLVSSPTFVACHNQSFIGKFDMLSGIRTNGTFLLNTTYTPEELSTVLTNEMKETIKAKNINFYTINAYKIAAELGLKGRINTIMQSAFFKLTGVIPYADAVKFMKGAIDKSYGKKGAAVLEMNYAAVDAAQNLLLKFDTSMLKTEAGAKAACGSGCRGCASCAGKAANKLEAYYNAVCKPINTMRGDELPVSAFNADGRVPTATTQFEKRELATTLPQWIPENCIKCGICSLVCPHATIRTHEVEGKYIVQVNPKDCTGCGSCANVCPAKNKALVMKNFDDPCFENLEAEYKKSLKYHENLPGSIDPVNIKQSQMLKPYFEFSGACAGCGETPYVKLVSQLFGNKMIIANATGCSSIYGGSSPTCPYTTDKNGHGPAWANSLFEDNAEFGYGIKMARDLQGKDASVWILGGDGWAYDIGYGGLDHIAAQNLDVNVLVMDTQVYSNTGGQASKATPAGAIAKFAAGGKPTQQKDLGAMLMNYDNVYVAQIAMGANYMQTLTAIKEAEAHKGPSVIIAYSTCINHGIDMSNGMKVMKNAVESGYWTLYRRKPATNGKAPEFILDSGEPKMAYTDFIHGETRYTALEKINPDAAKELFANQEKYNRARFEKYKLLAKK
jgi:pyruvate-ferredoxin/flavodoxin oxidoreductase